MENLHFKLPQIHALASLLFSHKRFCIFYTFQLLTYSASHYIQPSFIKKRIKQQQQKMSVQTRHVQRHHAMKSNFLSYFFPFSYIIILIKSNNECDIMRIKCSQFSVVVEELEICIKIMSDHHHHYIVVSQKKKRKRNGTRSISCHKSNEISYYRQ